MPLDLKNPGGREILLFGGGALGLALIYFALNKNKTTAAATAPTTSGGAGGIGGGTGIGGSQTGNVFTDIATPPNPPPVFSPTPTQTQTGIAGQPPPKFPHFRPRIEGAASPRLHGTTQGAESILGSGVPSMGPPVSGVGAGVANVSVGAQTVYNALRLAGLNAAQAAGVMGNIQNESSFRVDVSALDTNNQYSYGLVQWNAGSHPNAHQFVTGNLALDLKNQVQAIVQVVKGLGLPANASATQVAGAFASQFENCVGCQPGGSQYSQRVSNAAAFYNSIKQGAFNPPKSTSTVGNNFPGGLKAWAKKYGLAVPGSQPGVKAASRSQVQALFPKVTPVANRRRAAPKPKPFHAAGNIGKIFEGVAAAIRKAFPPMPKKPAYRPTPRRGPGHPLLH